MSTGIVVAETHAERDQPPGTDDDSTATSRQPSATAAAARLPPEGPSLASNYGDGPARRAQSLSARSSSSFRSLSPPVLSPAYVIDQPEPGLPRSVRVASPQRVLSPHATSQRVVSRRAPSLSPNQSTFSYGAPSPPLGSDIEAEYPAARPSVFLPRPTAASVDRARPVAARV